MAKIIPARDLDEDNELSEEMLLDVARKPQDLRLRAAGPLASTVKRKRAKIERRNLRQSKVFNREEK
jgi:hypothetical protein